MRLSGTAACKPPAALVALVLLALVTALLARPVVAAPPAYAVNSMPCPSGPGDIVTVPAGSNLSDVFAANSTGKTYLLEPGSYTMSSKIFDFGNKPSTTCFIGDGSRDDVVITANFNDNAFIWGSGSTQINLGLKSFTLNGAGIARGVSFSGDQAGWAMQDVTIQDTVVLGLVSSSTLSGTLANVTFERHTGGTAVYLYSDPAQVYQWSDLTVVDCSGAEGFNVYATVVLSGRVRFARHRGGRALFVVNGKATLTGDVVLEGNRNGAAKFAAAVVRFEASSTLLVKDNVAQGSGGGFEISGATVSVLGDARFINNTSPGYGGAVWALQANGDFSNTTFIGNTANNGGGAVYAGGSGTLDFTSAQFDRNTAEFGGAVFAGVFSHLAFSSAQFTSNTASGFGGAVGADGSTLDFSSAQFTSNTASRDGGALWLFHSSVDFASVCITQNVAGRVGSGIFLTSGSSVDFTTPGDARMGANSPLESTVVVGPGSSWTCAGSGAARGAGNYSIEGGPCACADASSTGEGSSSTCTCPAPTPVWYSAACECRVCEPGSGPCCFDTAEFAPCTRSVTFVPDNIKSPFCDGVELLVVVTDTAATGSSPLGQPAETAPAVDVPVVFGVSGDCEPSVQARTVRTDAQGRARVRVTAQGPGVAAVTAVVTSGGSLPRKAVLATSYIKFLPCGHGREHAYDDDDEHDGYARRPGYEHTRRARLYSADDDAVTAEAFEAAATQMALQALKEEGEEAVGPAAVSRRTV